LVAVLNREQLKSGQEASLGQASCWLGIPITAYFEICVQLAYQHSLITMRKGKERKKLQRQEKKKTERKRKRKEKRIKESENKELSESATLYLLNGYTLCIHIHSPHSRAGMLVAKWLKTICKPFILFVIKSDNNRFL